jgi:hypothetical protein
VRRSGALSAQVASYALTRPPAKVADAAPTHASLRAMAEVTRPGARAAVCSRTAFPSGVKVTDVSAPGSGARRKRTRGESASRISSSERSPAATVSPPVGGTPRPRRSMVQKRRSSRPRATSNRYSSRTGPATSIQAARPAAESAQNARRKRTVPSAATSATREPSVSTIRATR